MNIRRYVFGGFRRCLYLVQKFDFDTERRFTVILEDDAKVEKWFKPVPGQFHEGRRLRTGLRGRNRH